MTQLDINRIREILPHRYPFLLIDRVIDVNEGQSLTAIKNVSVNEPFFVGHFEHRPVFPGVLMVECIAQASAVLASLILDAEASKKYLYLFAGIDRARFKKIVEPGDQMRIEVELVRYKSRLWRCSGTITVNGDNVCSADILFTHKELA